MKLQMVTLLGGILLLASCQTFHPADSDRDSRISKAEMRTAVQESAFSNLDADQSGAVSKTEWMTQEDVRSPLQRFLRLDKDGNSELTLAEFADAARKHTTLDNLFGTWDQDGDGFLSPREF